MAKASRLFALLFAAFPFIASGTQTDESHSSKVVFVCEHGSVKSVIASAWFNRIASEKNIPLHSISLGVSPDEAIPKNIHENLRKDGFNLPGFKPKGFNATELSDAIVVVSIGVDEKKLIVPKGMRVELWSDVPPATTDYSASRDAIRKHINTLLEKLSKR